MCKGWLGIVNSLPCIELCCLEGELYLPRSFNLIFPRLIGQLIKQSIKQPIQQPIKQPIAQ